MPYESPFNSLKTDLADLTKRMKKFQKSKVTNLEDLIKRKAEEAKTKEEKDHEYMYVGKVFKVHKARLGYVKLKKHLKAGTQAEIYDKMLTREKTAPATVQAADPTEEKKSKYSF